MNLKWQVPPAPPLCRDRLVPLGRRNACKGWQHDAGNQVGNKVVISTSLLHGTCHAFPFLRSSWLTARCWERSIVRNILRPKLPIMYYVYQLSYKSIEFWSLVLSANYFHISKAKS